MIKEIKEIIKNAPILSTIFKKVYPYYVFYLHNKETMGILKKGVNDEGKILQIAHRLERGICLSNGGSKKECWGYRKANELVELLSKNKGINSDAIRIGKASLAAYIKQKELCEEPSEVEGLSLLKKKISDLGLSIYEDNDFGGVKWLTKEDMQHHVVNYEKIFTTRHSIREFSNEPVSIELIKKAVELAMTAPNSCNRQATEVYLINAEDGKICVEQNNMNANKFLIVCGKMDFFSDVELEDWLVNSSIFCGYLSLALHACGIGHCITRKNIIYKCDYNDEIRRLCNIPPEQKIIIEFALGNYKDEFIVPVSKRKSVEQVLHF